MRFSIESLNFSRVGHIIRKGVLLGDEMGSAARKEFCFGAASGRRGEGSLRICISSKGAWGGGGETGKNIVPLGMPTENSRKEFRRL